MELEFHQLDLRYEHLRRRSPEREKRLLSSLALTGQQTPIVVVGGERVSRVVVDGYKRVRALRQLKADTVLATSWELGEAEALVLERLMRASGGDDAFEQGWLLRELEGRFGLTHEELARRFDKSQSWVSRRLSLVKKLPPELQRRVQQGAARPARGDEIPGAHGARQSQGVPAARGESGQEEAEQPADGGPLRGLARERGGATGANPLGALALLAGTGGSPTGRPDREAAGGTAPR